MPLRSRRPQALGLQRRVRARAEPESEELVEEGSSDEETRKVAEDDSESESEAEADAEDDDDEDDMVLSASLDASQLSFASLARAQSTMEKKAAARAAKTSGGEAAGDDGGKEDKRAKTTAAAASLRASKHAPVEQTSKKPVSRRRDVVLDGVQTTAGAAGGGGSRPAARDPRFFPSAAPTGAEERRIERAYAFLDEYREDEIRALREAVSSAPKKGKRKKPEALDPETKQELRRALASMESRRETARRRARARELVEEHRRREKELVRQGKKPFYLKRSEQRRRLLEDRYAGMSGKQVDRAIERKRKKVAGKEKKELPMVRRRGCGTGGRVRG